MVGKWGGKQEMFDALEKEGEVVCWGWGFRIFERRLSQSLKEIADCIQPIPFTCIRVRPRGAKEYCCSSVLSCCRWSP